jgi:hypothetical protein
MTMKISAKMRTDLKEERRKKTQATTTSDFPPIIHSQKEIVGSVISIMVFMPRG